MNKEFRRLPSVDKVLGDEHIAKLAGAYPHELIVDVVRKQLEEERGFILSGKPSRSADEIIKAITQRVSLLENPSLRPVINATGVLLHTNLGRAPLSRETIEAMRSVAGSYSNLEFELESGKRGSRDVHVEAILCQITGAEAALVVNNNASAVLLALTVLAKRKEVVVSRGQAVEIGGGFRIPDVMRQSGARLVEVGTTNCTYVSDYEGAITPQTVALLRVHSSNFRVIGHTSEVGIEEMVAVARRHNIAVFDDAGSGCLLDTTKFGLSAEPMVQQSVKAGADLVLFSGDKLLGGPQAGIIVGKKELVDKLRKHPLMRALRSDKLRLAGLNATLLHYLRGEALSKVPIWSMIALPLEDIGKRAEKWARALPGMAKVVDGESMVGGGSLPGGTLPTRLVAIRGKNAQQMAEKLRRYKTPIIGRISGDVLLLDPRSVLPGEDEIIVEAITSLLKTSKDGWRK